MSVGMRGVVDDGGGDGGLARFVATFETRINKL